MLQLKGQYEAKQTQPKIFTPFDALSSALSAVQELRTRVFVVVESLAGPPDEASADMERPVPAGRLNQIEYTMSLVVEATRAAHRDLDRLARLLGDDIPPAANQ